MNSSEINQHRVENITQILTESLSPSLIEVIDESHLHAGHAGARSGKGHFKLNIASKRFNGLSVIKKHQLVYQLLGDLMQTDIHALSIVIKDGQ